MRLVKVFRAIRYLGVIAALVLIATGPVHAQKKVQSDPSRKKAIPKTPLAIYQKQVTDAIGSRWYAYTSSNINLFATGSLRLNFRILANGSVTGLNVLSNTSNEAFAAACTDAICDSQFPPIPEVVRRATKKDFIDFEEIRFTLYPN